MTHFMVTLGSPEGANIGTYGPFDSQAGGYFLYRTMIDNYFVAAKDFEFSDDDDGGTALTVSTGDGKNYGENDIASLILVTENDAGNEVMHTLRAYGMGDTVEIEFQFNQFGQPDGYKENPIWTITSKSPYQPEPALMPKKQPYRDTWEQHGHSYRDRPVTPREPESMMSVNIET